MVLFIDSNTYRREKLARSCRTNDMPSMAIGYEDYKYYTKPLITVLVDPSKSFMQNLNRYENTFYLVIVKRDEHLSLYPGLCSTVEPTGYIKPEKIKNIISDNLGFSLSDDYYNRVHINYPEEKIFVQNEKLYLTKTELKILRFFLYNSERTFRYDEIFEYLHYTNRIKIKTFDGYTQSINRESDKRRRERLIFKHREGYEMPKLTGKNPYLHDQRLNVFLN